MPQLVGEVANDLAVRSIHRPIVGAEVRHVGDFGITGARGVPVGAVPGRDFREAHFQRTELHRHLALFFRGQGLAVENEHGMAIHPIVNRRDL